jgi:hypothetical protein
MIPSAKINQYNNSLFGHYGEIGGIGDTRMLYLQTVLSMDQLRLITLVADIKGSEKWPVRALFQREVDIERVNKELIPYFKSKKQITFFNPITLVLLPHDNNGAVIGTNIKIVDKVAIDGAHEYSCKELDGFFNIKEYKLNPAYSQIEWNDSKVKLVAIDGQHRISALKHLIHEENINDWKIPVIIATHRNLNGNSSDLLQVIRDVFVNINNNAQPINKSRSVLLDDHQLHTIATQELIQACHSNDLNETGDGLPPLLIFDWRGLEEKKEEKNSLPALVSTIEISGLFESYLFNKDDDYLMARKILEASNNELEIGSHIASTDAEKIREILRAEIIPAFLNILNKLEPYRTYSDELRTLSKSTDILRVKVIEEVKFGSKDYLPSEQKALEKTRKVISEEIIGLKDRIPDLFKLDVTLRGIISAFCDLKFSLDLNWEKNGHEGKLGWIDFSNAFVKALNESNISKLKWKSLLHICFDQTERVINYRFEAAQSALGQYFQIAAVKKIKLINFSESLKIEIINECSNTLTERVKRSIKKDLKTTLREKNPTWSKNRIDEEANSKSAREAKEFVDKIIRA